MADTGYYFAYDYIKNKLNKKFDDNEDNKLIDNINIKNDKEIPFKNIDNKWPITQSKLANLFIRKDLNYKGILISDDIEMLALSGT